MKKYIPSPDVLASALDSLEAAKADYDYLRASRIMRSRQRIIRTVILGELHLPECVLEETVEFANSDDCVASNRESIMGSLRLLRNFKLERETQIPGKHRVWQQSWMLSMAMRNAAQDHAHRNYAREEAQAFLDWAKSRGMTKAVKKADKIVASANYSEKLSEFDSRDTHLENCHSEMTSGEMREECKNLAALRDRLPRLVPEIELVLETFASGAILVTSNPLYSYLADGLKEVGVGTIFVDWDLHFSWEYRSERLE